jgi:protein phosphatase
MILLGKTDTGRVRPSNQDNFATRELLDGRYFAIVCDGMGGYAGGNVASEIAVNTALETVDAAQPVTDAEAMLTNAITMANNMVYAAAIKDEELANMGTTAVAVWVSDGVATIGHVGDSRAYLYREGKLSQLTHDHSLVQTMIDSGSITVEDAKTHPYKNVITRVVGKDTPPEVSFVTCQLAEGDVILICTDGLTNMLEDAEIENILSMQTELTQGTCEKLVSAANEKGGTDNITAVLMVN